VQCKAYFNEASNGGECKYIYDGASYEGVDRVVFGEYIEVEDELSHQHCCSAFLFFVFLPVAVVLSFVAPIVV